jgi:hypothetical protein
MASEIAVNQSSTTIALHSRTLSQAQSVITIALAELATLLGEPLDPQGVRLRLMARELSDLSADAVLFAIDSWAKGNSSHLSKYEREHTMVGAFFPKPAQLRTIAKIHLRKARIEQETRERHEEEERRIRHRRENPEQYISMADVLRDVHERGKAKLLETAERAAKKPDACIACMGRVLAGLSPADLRALADLKEARQRNGASSQAEESAAAAETEE